MKKVSDFENNLEEIDKIIEKLESNDFSLEESIKEYERAIKLIKNSSEILDKVQGRILKVEEVNDEINIQEGEI